ncbi:hypothetical protein Tco_1093189 [Tanacetum coccineum]|uniref:Uncharacterized protein n=1 Tax=Tanacetum coccineum TaxID=301880 RepID=A0ABQ5IC04_9ASTR
MSSLRLAKGSNNGGNEVGADLGIGGGVSGLMGESMKGGGNGREWEGGDEDHRDSGDAGGEDIASSLATSESDHGSGYQQKDRKPSQNDKTEHGMEKTVQNQGQTHLCAFDKDCEDFEGPILAQLQPISAIVHTKPTGLEHNLANVVPALAPHGPGT